MANEEPVDIHHWTNGEAHGPVRMFVSDKGQVVLVCDVDRMAWELPNGNVRSQSKDSERLGGPEAIDTFTDRRAAIPPTTLEVVERILD